MTDTPVLERLARACMRGIAPGSVLDWDELDEEQRDWYRGGVDAILADIKRQGFKIERDEAPQA